jgi:hypothetical protein
MVALDIGWRRLANGDLRAAVWRATSPAAPGLPDWMQPWVRSSGDRGELVVPASWCDEMEHMNKIQATRDDKLNMVKTDLVRWFAERPEMVEPLGAQDIALWRSAARFAALVLRWREARQPDDSEIYEQAEAWRHQDKHLLEWHANTTDQLAARRREVYRSLAAALTRCYGTVVLESMDLPTVTAKGSVEAPNDVQADRARANARWAAIGSLRDCLRRDAERDGCHIIDVNPVGTTRVHADCDTWLEQSAAPSVTMWCPVCEMGFDQDHNAARNMLRLATGEVAEFAPPDN